MDTIQAPCVVCVAVQFALWASASLILASRKISKSFWLFLVPLARTLVVGLCAGLWEKTQGEIKWPHWGTAIALTSSSV